LKNAAPFSKGFCFEVQNMNEHGFSYSNTLQNQEATCQENQNRKMLGDRCSKHFFIPRSALVCDLQIYNHLHKIRPEPKIKGEIPLIDLLALNME
jgi:hypothetical protein